MDELKLKELAIASSLSVQQRADMNEAEFFESEGLRREFRRTAPDAILSLLAKLESAQGEIRALRCTEAGLLSELQTLREERTAWRVTAENAEAAVKQARIDALDVAMEMCRNMVAPNLASNTAPYSAYEAACIDCESAIESLKGTP